MSQDNYTAGNSKQWGVTKHRGARTTSLARGSEVHSTNRERELHFEFDYNDLPRFLDNDFIANMWLPDGSIVKDITFEITEEFKGEADAQLQMGLMDQNGDILSYSYFGIVDKVVGKKTGFQWHNQTVTPVAAGSQEGGDGANYTLFHVCAVSPTSAPCDELFTCGEARVTITLKTPFYAYHYDGFDGVNAINAINLIPNQTGCGEGADPSVYYNPCIGATYTVVDALPELGVEVAKADQIVAQPCADDESSVDCTPSN